MVRAGDDDTAVACAPDGMSTTAAAITVMTSRDIQRLRGLRSNHVRRSMSYLHCSGRTANPSRIVFAAAQAPQQPCR